MRRLARKKFGLQKRPHAWVNQYAQFPFDWQWLTSLPVQEFFRILPE
jgi:hypothetical protein